MTRIAALLFFLFSVPLFADAVRLSGGQVLEGSIVGESDEVLIIETSTGPVSIDKKEILVIEREGQNKIPRIPAREVSPVKAIGFSMIPGISGFYYTDNPLPGVFFSVATLASFTKWFQFYSGKKRINYYKSDTFQDRYFYNDPGESYLNNRYYLPGFINTSFNLGIPYQKTFPAYIFLQESLYNRSPEYKVAGKMYDEVTYRRIRNRFGKYFIFFTMLDAGLSYWYSSSQKSSLSKQSPVGDTDLAFYVVPSLDDAVEFGLYFRF